MSSSTSYIKPRRRLDITCRLAVLRCTRCNKISVVLSSKAWLSFSKHCITQRLIILVMHVLVSYYVNYTETLTYGRTRLTFQRSGSCSSLFSMTEISEEQRLVLAHNAFQYHFSSKPWDFPLILNDAIWLVKF